MRRLALLLAFVPTLAWGQADPQTLADIRAQIASLGAEIGGLRAELSASGQLGSGVAGSTPLERLDAAIGECEDSKTLIGLLLLTAPR